ncbi:hypothetical protein J2X57_001634 [Luteibacter sp. 1214]|uniref:hypothetical protein n=1 Tax=Luteibacter sp. 1214 TaxID=2817735 RepID=UPI00285AC0F5|nr:hypothetical protein [Luteibacter sp. 1214]MDR6642427.1 hypothetical protein [Luteibacter sp. 1214]
MTIVSIRLSGDYREKTESEKAQRCDGLCLEERTGRGVAGTWLRWLRLLTLPVDEALDHGRTEAGDA